MQKREFIKTLALAGISLPLSGKNTDEIMYKFQNYSAYQIANDEDFWLNLRNAYKLKTDYINLDFRIFSFRLANIQMICNFQFAKMIV